MTQATAEPKLLCPECRRENEAQRIYCHDCGTRLDRSTLAKVVSTEEDPKQTRARLQAMFSGRGAKFRQQFFLFSKVILGAVLLAALVQLFRSPDVPERVKPAVAEL